MTQALELAVKALEGIADPVERLRRYAEERGNQLDGTIAQSLSNDVGFLKGLATTALTALRSLSQEEVSGWRPTPWPEGIFRVHDPDPSDEHGPIYLVCPGGLMVNFSNDPTPGVDDERVHWVAAMLNRSRAASPPAPAQPATISIDEHERVLGEVIDQRDDFEEAFGQAYYLVVGRSPEWSNKFGLKQALEEIDDAQQLLRKSAAPTQPPPSNPYEGLVEAAKAYQDARKRYRDSGHERLRADMLLKVAERLQTKDGE